VNNSLACSDPLKKDDVPKILQDMVKSRVRVVSGSSGQGGDGVSVQDTVASAVFDLRQRRSNVAMLMIVALLLCSSLVHAIGNGQHAESTLSAAPTVHVETATENSLAPVAALHGTQVSVEKPGGVWDQGDACGVGCGGHDAIQALCMLTFLTALVFFTSFLTRLLVTKDRLRERTMGTVVSVQAGRIPMTPSPQELSISRT
jgi:hypothetical protein